LRAVDLRAVVLRAAFLVVVRRPVVFFAGMRESSVCDGFAAPVCDSIGTVCGIRRGLD
jgi:hypothetical protein